ncbi:MAG: acyl-CoA-binding protein [Sphingobacteriales bacterium]|nr:MAG: acyl-CoA-binding protein [Sphingobacteriales bacterium]
MNLQDAFAIAQADSKNLAAKPDNDTLLQLYSLYKQATAGDATGDGPENMFDFVGKAKHEAWSGLKGMSRETAMEQYVALVNKLKGS